MEQTYLPPIKQVQPMTLIRRERRLPVPGLVAVRVNEKVLATDVIAEAEAAPRHIFIDLVRGLGVPLEEVDRYLNVARGERVEEGDILASRGGLTRRNVRAPGDGRVADVSQGRMLFEMRSEPIELRAGFPGIVTTTDGSRTVTLETVGALIQGEWGNGRQEWGVMRFVGDGPGGRLDTDQLDINLRGAVLVTGILDNLEALGQAVELSVRGLIAGSMPSEMIPSVRRVPFPVILTDGFGRLPMNAPTFNLLQSSIGREAALDARRGDKFSGQIPEIIIPLPGSQRVSGPDEVLSLTVGMRVRVLRAPYRGVCGLVRAIPERAVLMPSGVRAHCARVELDGIGLTEVPEANLEVL
jgi:hypothetical protein